MNDNDEVRTAFRNSVTRFHARNERRAILGTSLDVAIGPGSRYQIDAMIADEVNAIPIALWEWGIQRRTGLQRKYPKELGKLTLLPSEEASVTARGIRFLAAA